MNASDAQPFPSSGYVGSRRGVRMCVIRLRSLTYFQPRTVLQLRQDTSATVCRPVMSMRSSRLPVLTFALPISSDDDIVSDRDATRMHMMASTLIMADDEPWTNMQHMSCCQIVIHR
jgi:hypothetical protein